MFQSVLNISNTLCLYVFCMGACVHVGVCVLGFCPAKYMFLFVYELSCDYAGNWRNVCMFFRLFVFLITQLSVSFQRANSGIQFDRCENLSKKCIYSSWKEIYCCCKHTITHVDILSYNQPIVSLYLRYRGVELRVTSFEMHLPETGYQCSLRE